MGMKFILTQKTYPVLCTMDENRHLQRHITQNFRTLEIVIRAYKLAERQEKVSYKSSIRMALVSATKKFGTDLMFRTANTKENL